MAVATMADSAITRAYVLFRLFRVILNVDYWLDDATEVGLHAFLRRIDAVEVYLMAFLEWPNEAREKIGFATADNLVAEWYMFKYGFA